MNTYPITITRTTVKTVGITADSKEEAEALFAKAYGDADFNEHIDRLFDGTEPMQDWDIDSHPVTDTAVDENITSYATERAEAIDIDKYMTGKER